MASLTGDEHLFNTNTIVISYKNHLLENGTINRVSL